LNKKILYSKNKKFYLSRKYYFNITHENFLKMSCFNSFKLLNGDINILLCQ